MAKKKKSLRLLVHTNNGWVRAHTVYMCLYEQKSGKKRNVIFTTSTVWKSFYGVQRNIDTHLCVSFCLSFDFSPQCISLTLFAITFFVSLLFFLSSLCIYKRKYALSENDFRANVCAMQSTFVFGVRSMWSPLIRWNFIFLSLNYSLSLFHSFIPLLAHSLCEKKKKKFCAIYRIEHNNDSSRSQC